MNKKLMEQAGGKNSLAFGMGKSNAKVYVQPTDGIRFSDVAGEDEAKESLAEIVDYLHSPQKYTDVGASKVRDLFRQAKEKAPCIVLSMRSIRSERNVTGRWEATMNASRR